MKDTTPIYFHSAAYAREHGELDQYRASYKANIACKEATEQTSPTIMGITGLIRQACSRSYSSSIMAGFSMCLPIRSGRKTMMDAFPATIKPGRRRFRSARIEMLLVTIGTAILLWTAAIPG